MRYTGGSIGRVKAAVEAYTERHGTEGEELGAVSTNLREVVMRIARLVLTIQKLLSFFGTHRECCVQLSRARD